MTDKSLELLSRRTLLGFAAFGLVVSRHIPPEELLASEPGGVLLIAHNANSVTTARGAIAMGADIVEADVWDDQGKLVVAHTLTIGDWKPPSSISEALFRPLPFEAWLEVLPDGAAIMLDFKGGNKDSPKLIAETLSNSAKDLQTLVCNEHWSFIQASGSYPNVQGFLTVGNSQAWKEAIPLLHSPEISGLSVAKELVTSSVVSIAHELGVLVFAWTVNDLSEAQDLVNLGVDGITTDKVEALAPSLSNDVGPLGSELHLRNLSAQ